MNEGILLTELYEQLIKWEKNRDEMKRKEYFQTKLAIWDRFICLQVTLVTCHQREKKREKTPNNKICFIQAEAG